MMGRKSLHGFWDARDQRKRMIEKISWRCSSVIVCNHMTPYLILSTAKSKQANKPNTPIKEANYLRMCLGGTVK